MGLFFYPGNPIRNHIKNSTIATANQFTGTPTTCSTRLVLPFLSCAIKRPLGSSTNIKPPVRVPLCPCALGITITQQGVACQGSDRTGWQGMKEQQRNQCGRPRLHEDKAAAQRAASAAYRARKRARRQILTVCSGIIDLSALPAWKVGQVKGWS